MMESSIYNEIHEVKDDIKKLSENIIKLNILVENIIERTKEQDEKISKFGIFKSKVLGALCSFNVIIVIAISILAILI